VADGAGFWRNVLRVRDPAVEASDSADLSAQTFDFPFAKDLRATVQKSRHLNNFKIFEAACAGISLDD
jgi:hypothetical protein